MTLTEFAQPAVRVAGFVVSMSTEDAATVVTLRGEADLVTRPLVVDVLVRVIAGHDGPVVVDLAQTAFIDTGTVSALARASQFLCDRERGLTLRSPSRAAVRQLTFVGLSNLVEPVGATDT